MQHLPTLLPITASCIPALRKFMIDNRAAQSMPIALVLLKAPKEARNPGPLRATVCAMDWFAIDKTYLSPELSHQ